MFMENPNNMFWNNWAYEPCRRRFTQQKILVITVWDLMIIVTLLPRFGVIQILWFTGYCRKCLIITFIRIKKWNKSPFTAAKKKDRRWKQKGPATSTSRSNL